MVEIFWTCKVPYRNIENNIYAKQMVSTVNAMNNFAECVKEYQKKFL